MTRYKKYLIIIPTAATLATIAAFSASAYDTGNNDPAPIVASSTGSSHLSNRAAIKEEIESNNATSSDEQENIGQEKNSSGNVEQDDQNEQGDQRGGDENGLEVEND